MAAPQYTRPKALKAVPPSLRVRISRELDAKLRYMEAVTGLSRSDVVRLLLRRAPRHALDGWKAGLRRVGEQP
jgi:hypothetical protein